MKKQILTTLALFSSATAASLPGVLSGAQIGDWTTFDPAYCYENQCGEVLQNTLDTLIFYQGESSSRFVPALAQSVPSKQNGGISTDGKTYTFKIKKNLKFADGTPVRASDVAYSFKRLLVQNGGAAYLLSEALFGDSDGLSPDNKNLSFQDVERAIEAPDDFTVVFRLKRPFAPFLAILASPYVGSVYAKAAAIKAGAWDGQASSWQKFNALADKDSPFQKNVPVGSGPFVMERFDVGSLVVLKRNAVHWRKPSQIERVILQVVRDPTTRMQMFMKGDVDFASFDPSQFDRILASNPDFKATKPVPALGIDGIFMNHRINGQGTGYLGSGQLDGKGIPADFFSDVHVRKALAYSLDYKTIINSIMQNHAIQMNSVLIKGLYSAAGKRLYTFDRDRATREFKAAFGGKVWQNGFTLPIFYNSGNDVRKNILGVLKSNVESLNPKFKLEIRELPSSQIRAQRAQNQMTLWLGNWSADYADPYNFIQPLLHSQGTLGSVQNIKNSTLDRLIEQAGEETNTAARNKLLSSIEKIAFDEVLGIPVFQGINIDIETGRVSGIVRNPVYAGYWYYPMVKK
ncbi:ABC transporter substrate-binding protein [Deinococcus cellulosilyticus]|uniref:Peptide ABC transporter substrate-binding protein n=1 Tax=Deinococcus cellulosilyticus (strain DSM 18568 / NBRC 106333 / KACC 11606 / 5516J-15) TaxID=1223518 RepID=A0A511MZ02_DEIC1|nr:ABC transporter substrate-binding protein [Deinococcus cellulosilyticus]GEM45538.1 peptide ABC transporter substrate-binding protein [Deinococcus cellulosilyticus NBRC 106333 = KACC 11606]